MTLKTINFVADRCEVPIAIGPADMGAGSAQQTPFELLSCFVRERAPSQSVCVALFASTLTCMSEKAARDCSIQMRLDHKQIQALAGFRNALRRFLAFSEEATRAEGVTPQQYQAMLAIKAQPHGTMPVGDLGAELLLKANSTVQLVDRLARMGLVERQRTELDRRLVRVMLTDAGTAVLLRLASLHLEQLSKRKKQLADILRQVKNM